MAKIRSLSRNTSTPVKEDFLETLEKELELEKNVAMIAKSIIKYVEMFFLSLSQQ